MKENITVYSVAKIFSAYVNHINHAFIPGNEEIIVYENIESTNDHKLSNIEAFEESISKISITVLTSHILN